jgi:hypothetical protein
VKVISSYLRARRSAFRVTVVIRQLVHAPFLGAKRESVLITKHGKPVAKLVPADKNIDDIYNFLAGKGAVTGDVERFYATGSFPGSMCSRPTPPFLRQSF